jgi:septum formation inhibitor MinC
MSKQNKTTIKSYIDELKNQINIKKKNARHNYVFLNLDKTNNKNVSEKQDILNDLLQQKNSLDYIIRNYNQEKSITDNKEDKWSLCISGYKHGATKDSPRKLGLFAYSEGYKKKKFKTKIIYDSGSDEYENYLRREIIESIQVKIEIFFKTNLNLDNIYIRRNNS